jgi:hypothetical protein
VAASPGLGVGRVVRVFHEDIEVKEDAAPTPVELAGGGSMREDRNG